MIVKLKAIVPSSYKVSILGGRASVLMGQSYIHYSVFRTRLQERKR
jgi:hypothetical protein